MDQRVGEFATCLYISTYPWKMSATHFPGRKHTSTLVGKQAMGVVHMVGWDCIYMHAYVFKPMAASYNDTLFLL